MNILINCSNLKIGGGLQVAHSFLSKIEDFKHHFFIIVVSTELNKIIGNINFDKRNSKVLTYDVSSNPIKAITGKDVFLNSIVKKNKINVVFSLFGPTYWRPKVKHISGFAKAHYVYSESPFYETLSLFHTLKLYLKKVFHMYDFKFNNDELVTENGDVSKRLEKIFKGKPITTITNYYNQIFDREEFWNKNINLPESNEFTLLTISANYPHKNLKIIPKVIEVLYKKYHDVGFRFIVTLDRKDLKIDDELAKNIVFLGKIEITQCPYLYLQSDAVFLPTLLETFTATYPESMRMKKPLLTSNLNFARGLCENAAIYFDPLSADDIAEKIYEVATNSVLREKLIEEGEKQLKKYDSYNERAQKYIDIITR